MISAATGAALTTLALVGCGPKTPPTVDPSPQSVSASPSAASPTASSPVSAVPSGSATPSARPSSARPSASAGAVSLQISGGLAGRMDRLAVAADGSWTFSDAKGRHRTGRLSATQRATLGGLVSDPRLSAEARYRVPAHTCADGLYYRFTSAGLTINRPGCGAGPNTPAFNAVISFLTDATPL